MLKSKLSVQVQQPAHPRPSLLSTKSAKSIKSQHRSKKEAAGWITNSTTPDDKSVQAMNTFQIAASARAD